MFLEFYGLREQPFGVTPNPRFMYASPSHREVLASLLYAVQSDLGFSALIADPGMGKTTLLFDLLERYRDSANTAFLFNSQCSSKDLVRHLLAELGVECESRDQFSMHEKFKETLLQSARDKKKVLLILDEAHNLDVSVLETIRLLSNFETIDTKLMHIVLAGQTQLAHKLASPSMTQLYQRIAMVNRLKPFTREETFAYISHRLEIAGFSEAGLFSPDALEKIAHFSGGVPRTINRLCFASMSIACALNQRQIQGSVVDEVKADLNLGTLLPTLAEPQKKPRIRAQSRSSAMSPEVQKNVPEPAIKEESSSGSGSDFPPPPTSTREPLSTFDFAEPQSPTFTGDIPSTYGLDKPPTPPPPLDPDLERVRSALAPQLRPMGKAALRAQEKASWHPPSRQTVTTALLLIVCVFLIGWLVYRGVPDGTKIFANSSNLSSSTDSVAADAAGARGQDGVDDSTEEIASPRANTSKRASGRPVLDLLKRTGPTPSAKPDMLSRSRINTVSNVSLPSFGKPATPGNTTRVAPSAQTKSNEDTTAPRITIATGEAPLSLANAMGSVLSNSPKVAIDTPASPSDGIVPGRVLQNPKPIYPEEAKRLSIEGPVLLSLVITKEGKVKDVHRVSGDARLANAAEQAVRRWKYQPYMLNGEPVEANANVTIRFNLSSQ